MPPETSQWDRKDFFKERKRERSWDSLGSVSRWRDRDIPYNGWGGPPELRSRLPGHCKQGGWHLSSEGASRGFTPSRTNEKYMDGENFRRSWYRPDGNNCRNVRENKGPFSQKDWKVHSWGNGAPLNKLGRPYDISDQRLVDNIVPNKSCPHSDFVNTWDQAHFKNQNHKIGGVNGLGAGQRVERENLLDSMDWKPPRKWTRSGTLSARGSGFSHSSSSKSIGGQSKEVKADGQHGNVTPAYSSSGDALTCVTSAAPSEDMSSRKKPRLGWGEGLAKYEKKIVEGPEDNATKNEVDVCGSTEPFHSYKSSLADKSSCFTGLSCTSLATRSSSPGGEEKVLMKAASIDKNSGDFSGSPNIASQNRLEGLSFSLEKLELSPITYVSSKLSELLQCGDPSGMDSSFVRATAMNKLQAWKVDVMKALETTESEIDLIENELKSLMSESRKSCPCLGSSSSFPGECRTELCEDMIVENKVDALVEEDAIKDNDIESPDTVTCKFVESLSSAKDATEDCPPSSTDSLGCDSEDILYHLILASNKDSANRASEPFTNLLQNDALHLDNSRATSVSCLQNSLVFKEKFAKRNHFLRFKERVTTLKFKAFNHLWKEDLWLLSFRKRRAKSQKRVEISSRTTTGGYQKNRSSIRSRFSSAGNSSLVPSAEIIDFASKLLSDSQIKIYRNTLKMPALILDNKDRMKSRFVSSNGLVEDPCAVEKERAKINIWTSEEKETFIDMLAAFGKDFRKIASFLEHKTTADCVEFYYKNHKSDCFKRTKKKPEFEKQGKPYSTSTYLVTSEKIWNRELDMLGAASANADKARFSGLSNNYGAEGGDSILERSSRLDIFGDERETVAADVLAGICGSLSSEAMGSSITSSFDTEHKYQKVGSLIRPTLTPDVSLNVDNKTCSDESCGDVDSADWTDEEKSIFVRAVSSYGKDFAMISQCIETRSEDQCKVFFSKARKCLGLDMMIHSTPVSCDACGGGADSKDACFVETGSVVCSDKSGSKMDEDQQVTGFNMNNAESDMNRSEVEEEEKAGTVKQDDPKDPELRLENLVIDDFQVEGVQELDLDGDCNIENRFDSEAMPVDACKNEALSCKNEALSSGSEAGGGETTGDSMEDLVSVEDGNSHSLSTLGAEVETKVVGEVSADGLKTELDSQQQLPENCLHDKRDGNMDASASGESGSNGSVKSVHRDSAATQSLALDFGRIRDERCQRSASVDNYRPCLSRHLLMDGVDSSQVLRGYPLQVLRKEVNGNISCNKLGLLQSYPKLNGDLHSDRYLSHDFRLHKCNGIKTRSSGAKVSFMSEQQNLDHLKSHSWSSSDAEKQLRNGDVKLFGQILSTNSGVHENEDKGVPQHSKLNGNSINLKFEGTHSLYGNSVSSLEHDNYLGIENLPMRSYGFWDGKRIQTGCPFPDSAMLLAKYPAAFGNYPAPSRPSYSALNNEILNGVSVFPSGEIISGSEVRDYKLYLSQDSTKVQAIDMKQQQERLYSEMQRCYGFEAVSHMLVGGSCTTTGVSDPVAAIKMHYAKTEQLQQDHLSRGVLER